ncbi:thiamine-phosphate kinase [Polynucleobacter asymbioticus]|jgi:thiamine-monophosphate kinase|uniref:thiamine-phosphate kinase n=1 Tax=Polynucleobacter asymbioticus TaxID=576611 RepID=UPI0008F8A3F5|nr:thiamine-phosphate kinase [Polynucleobacter asymbioticus]
MHSPSNPIGEFDLIERFFKTGTSATEQNENIPLGIGDDCALIKQATDSEIAITTDMLVEGRHFFAGADPEQLGRKALAVNLSDLAAMGAEPLGFTLAIAMPKADIAWLEAFSKGLLDSANLYGCPLIGGDTTAGPLTLSITALGNIPQGKAIRRSGAKIEDDVWVSGNVGDARLALAALRHEIPLSAEDLKQVEKRMHQPTPRIELGICLRDIATAALDISDGLLGDLNHVLKQSQVDAQIFLNQIPKSETLKKQSTDIQNQFAASGGDDYEICFTAPNHQREAIKKLSKSLDLPLTLIGRIIPIKNKNPQVHLINSDGATMSAIESKKLLQSFDHFSS